MSNIKAQKMIVVGSSQVIPEVVGEGMIFVIDLSLGYNDWVEMEFPSENYSTGYIYQYNFVLDWGDGFSEIITESGTKEHNYGTDVGIYEITITGVCEALKFGGGGE